MHGSGDVGALGTSSSSPDTALSALWWAQQPGGTPISSVEAKPHRRACASVVYCYGHRTEILCLLSPCSSPSENLKIQWWTKSVQQFTNLWGLILCSGFINGWPIETWETNVRPCVCPGLKNYVTHLTKHLGYPTDTHTPDIYQVQKGESPFCRKSTLEGQCGVQYQTRKAWWLTIAGY